MPVKKRNSNAKSAPIGSMSSKNMRRQKPINGDHLVKIEPLTDSQKLVFESWVKISI